MIYIEDIIEEIKKYGSDIIYSEHMQEQKNYIQHGRVSVFGHCIHVAYISLCIVKKFNLNVDEESLIRGALLHDYFLYDWHVPDSSHRLHGFTHAKKSFENACRDFKVNDIEKDIILKHMFPLNILLPKYKESTIVILADKYCAINEMRTNRFMNYIVGF